MFSYNNYSVNLQFAVLMSFKQGPHILNFNDNNEPEDHWS